MLYQPSGGVGHRHLVESLGLNIPQMVNLRVQGLGFRVKGFRVYGLDFYGFRALGFYGLGLLNPKTRIPQHV